jgi:hypothetical protein
MRSGNQVDWLWLFGVVAVIAWLVAVVDMIRRRAELSRAGSLRPGF